MTDTCTMIAAAIMLTTSLSAVAGGLVLVFLVNHIATPETNA
jgi:hypothetical protein